MFSDLVKFFLLHFVNCTYTRTLSGDDNYALLATSVHRGRSPSPGDTSNKVAQLTHVEVSMQSRGTGIYNYSTLTYTHPCTQ